MTQCTFLTTNEKDDEKMAIPHSDVDGRGIFFHGFCSTGAHIQ